MAASTDLLILDQGGQSARALRLDASTRVTARARRLVRPVLAGGRAEQDAEELAEATAAALDELLKATAGLAPPRAAALTCQRATIVCWDRSTGRALSPAIGWQDTRGGEYLRALPPRLRQQIAARTGMRCSPHYGAVKLRWCLDHLPAVRGAARSGRLVCGPLASFLAARLLVDAPALSEPTIASRTLLWNRHSSSWDEELLAAFQLPEQALPALAPSRCRHGMLRQAPQVPLELISGDQACVPWALGPPAPDTVWVNFGTGAFVQRWLPVPPTAETPLLTSPSPTGEGVLLEGTVNGCATAIDWLCRKHQLEPAAALQAAAEEQDPPLFLNTIGGLGSPFWHSGLPAQFIGAGSATARLRAVMESVLFLVQANLEQLAKAGRIRQIVLCGGWARSPLLRHLAAGLFDGELRWLSEPEATGRGAATLLSAGPAPMDKSVTVPVPAVPDRALRQRYRRWREALEALLSEHPRATEDEVQ